MEQLAEGRCQKESTDFLVQAQSYYQTASRAYQRRKCFTPDILFNILCMSIEKYFMGFFMCNQHMPANHTMNDMVSSFKLFHPIDEDLERDLLEIDVLQDNCSLDPQKKNDIKMEYIPRLIDTTYRVSKTVFTYLD